jgi:uncharacterized protein YkwD
MQSLSRTRRPAALSAALLAALAVAPGSLGSEVAMTRAESRLAVMINQVRAAHGLGPLRVDAGLERAARAHSYDMLRRGYFAHGAFAARLRGYGVRSNPLGENLAWGTGRYARSRPILDAWLRSPGHRANLLQARFHRVGLGMPVGSFAGHRYARVVTADFAG